MGALSGFEYVAILAGECRSAARTIGQSVIISAPVICLMFILGTSSVLAFVGGQPSNVIGPIPQTMRAALGSTGVGAWAAPFAIGLVLARAIAAASLIFTGLTRLPMTAGWDHLTPDWFTRLDARRGTPVNSILFVAALAGLLSSIVSLAIAVYPIVDVTSRMEYAAKICAVVLVANGLGVVIYRAGRAKAEHTAK